MHRDAWSPGRLADRVHRPGRESHPVGSDQHDQAAWAAADRFGCWRRFGIARELAGQRTGISRPFDNGHSGKQNATNHRDTGLPHLQSGEFPPMQSMFLSSEALRREFETQIYISMSRLTELLPMAPKTRAQEKLSLPHRASRLKAQWDRPVNSNRKMHNHFRHFRLPTKNATYNERSDRSSPLHAA
jgi:hypothetical protein